MATGSSEISIIAERYASAIYELADESKILDDIALDLRNLQNMLEESEDLTKATRSPLIDSHDKAMAMQSILEQAGANQLTQKFIGVVARNNRLFILPAMIRSFLLELANRRGEITAEVTSAKKLDALQLEDVTNVLRNTLGSKVTVDAKLDSSLIGGLVVKIGSRMIDASIKSKLQRLQLAMKGAQ